MKYIKQFLKWYFKEFWEMMAWFMAIGLFVGFLQALIVYPVQVLATLLIGGFCIISFMFVTSR